MTSFSMATILKSNFVPIRLKEPKHRMMVQMGWTL